MRRQALQNLFGKVAPRRRRCVFTYFPHVFCAVFGRCCKYPSPQVEAKRDVWNSEAREEGSIAKMIGGVCTNTRSLYYRLVLLFRRRDDTKAPGDAAELHRSSPSRRVTKFFGIASHGPAKVLAAWGSLFSCTLREKLLRSAAINVAARARLDEKGW